MSQGGRVAVGADEDVIAASRVRDLERLLSRKMLEVEVQREALAVARGEKSRLAVAVPITGRFPMKTVDGTIGVAPSSLVEQLRAASRAAAVTAGRVMTNCSLPIASSPMLGRPTATGRSLRKSIARAG